MEILCPKCEEPLTFVSGDFPTGVSSLGYHEMSYEEGYYCERDNEVFSVEDVEPAEPVVECENSVELVEV